MFGPKKNPQIQPRLPFSDFHPSVGGAGLSEFKSPASFLSPKRAMGRAGWMAGEAQDSLMKAKHLKTWEEVASKKTYPNLEKREIIDSQMVW